MTSQKLTDGYVEGIEPPDRDSVYVWDTALPRFGVRVTRAGARIYLVQYRPKGGSKVTRRISIAQHDGETWNVTKARAAARKILAPVDLGHDPFADRSAARQAEAEEKRRAVEAAAAAERAQELRQRDSFRAVANRYIALAAKPGRSWAETERLLKFGEVKELANKRPSGHRTAPDAAGPMQAWADRHIGDIRRSDVADLMDTIKKRSPAVARATYAALRGLFGWCVERDLIAVSPCVAVTAPPRPEARDRVLADEELRLIWKASDGLGSTFSAIVKLLMLTGQRRAEVAGMTWAELDLKAATWRIPRERAKNGRAHEVDLCPSSIRILEKLPRGGSYVFPVTRKGAAEGAARGFSATKRRLDALIETVRVQEATEAGHEPPAAPSADWRLHDLRRTAATGMAAMGFPPHVVERVLNHVSGVQSGLVGVYQRHEYRAERKAASAAWGAHVKAITSGEAMASNVRRLKKA